MVHYLHFVRLFASLFGGIAALLVTLEAEPLEARSFNLGKGGLALGGYDAVSYFQEGGPAKGDPGISLKLAELSYWFASEANRSAFAAEPERYRPAFGGWCAWAMLDGDKVDVDPESFRIFEGRLLLFYDGLWGDTRRKWVEKSAKESEAKLFKLSEEKWQEILRKSAK